MENGDKGGRHIKLGIPAPSRWQQYLPALSARASGEHDGLLCIYDMAS